MFRFVYLIFIFVGWVFLNVIVDRKVSIVKGCWIWLSFRKRLFLFKLLLTYCYGVF